MNKITKSVLGWFIILIDSIYATILWTSVNSTYLKNQIIHTFIQTTYSC